MYAIVCIMWKTLLASTDDALPRTEAQIYAHLVLACINVAVRMHAHGA